MEHENIRFEGTFKAKVAEYLPVDWDSVSSLVDIKNILIALDIKVEKETAKKLNIPVKKDV